MIIAACKAHRFGFPTSRDFLFLLVGYLKVPKAKGALHHMTAEFFRRRLQENERMLGILTRRIMESFPNEVVLISDLNEIVSIINNLTRDFERIVEDFERNTPPLPQCNQRLLAVTRSGLVGRPRLQVLQEQLETLHNAAGFRWADVGRILGISERTLRRHRHEFVLPVGMGEDFSI